MDSEDTSKKSTSIEIIFMKYGDQDQAIMTVNEICKFHINPSKNVMHVPVKFEGT